MEAALASARKAAAAASATAAQAAAAAAEASACVAALEKMLLASAGAALSPRPAAASTSKPVASPTSPTTTSFKLVASPRNVWSISFIMSSAKSGRTLQVTFVDPEGKKKQFDELVESVAMRGAFEHYAQITEQKAASLRFELDGRELDPDQTWAAARVPDCARVSVNTGELWVWWAKASECGRGLDGFIYTNCLARNYNTTATRFRAIIFDTSRYGHHSHRIDFDAPVTEAVAVEAAERWLSQPLDRAFFDVVKDDLWHSPLTFEEATGSGDRDCGWTRRGDVLTDLHFLEDFCEIAPDSGVFRISCGS